VEIDQGRVTISVIGREGGIFRWEPGNPVEEVAGGQTLVPDAGGCTFWNQEDQGVANHVFEAEGDAIVFAGVSDDCGIRGSSGTFLWRSGSIEKLGDVAHAAVFEAQRVAFFTRDWNGAWERIFDLGHLGIGYEYDSMDEFDGRQLLLDGRESIYVLRADGSLTKVLQQGAELDGEPVEEIHAGDLRRDELVLGVRRSSGHAIYVAQLPPIPIEIDVRSYET
jgi:hypothetical protein